MLRNDWISFDNRVELWATGRRLPRAALRVDFFRFCFGNQKRKNNFFYKRLDAIVVASTHSKGPWILDRSGGQPNCWWVPVWRTKTTPLPNRPKGPSLRSWWTICRWAAANWKPNRRSGPIIRSLRSNGPLFIDWSTSWKRPDNRPKETIRRPIIRRSVEISTGRSASNGQKVDVNCDPH